MQHQVFGPFAARRARPEDAGAVADLWLRSRHASIPAIPPPVHSDDDVRGHFRTIVQAENSTWVVDDDEELVALLVLDGRWVEHLYVDPHRTGRGIGSALIGLAKGLSPEGLALWTFASNVGARRFYGRHDLVVAGSTDGDNEEQAPDVLYRWPGR